MEPLILQRSAVSKRNTFPLLQIYRPENGKNALLTGRDTSALAVHCVRVGLISMGGGAHQ